MITTRTWRDVEIAIVRACRLAVGASESQMVFDFQPAQRPAGKPFFTLHITNDVTSEPFPELRIESDDETSTITHLVNRVLSVRVSAYGQGMYGDFSARAQLTILQMGLGAQECKSILEHAGLALIDRGSIQHLPVLLDTAYESRAVVELQFGLRDFVRETVANVATVETEGTYT